MKQYLPYIGAALLIFAIGGWVVRAEDGHGEKEQRIQRIEKYVDVEIKKQEGEEEREKYRQELCAAALLPESECKETD